MKKIYTIVAEAVTATTTITIITTTTTTTTTDGAGDWNSWGTDLTRCLLELAPFVSAG